MVKELEPFVKKLVDAYNGDDPSAFDSIFAEDCVLVRDEEEAQGREAIKGVLARIKRAFPDIVYGIDDVIAVGNRLVLRWHARGTHRGEYLGMAPTGRPASYTGITIYERENGTIGRIWVIADLLSLLRRLRSERTVEPPTAQA
jgi:steroid delta-isomerase-like uncharacterized protein